MDPQTGLKVELERMLQAIREGKRPPVSQSLDVDDVAVWLAWAFNKAGYKTRLKLVKQAGMPDFHHIFVEVWHPKERQWIPLDPHRTPPEDWADEAVVGV